MVSADSDAGVIDGKLEAERHWLGSMPRRASDRYEAMSPADVTNSLSLLAAPAAARIRRALALGVSLGSPPSGPT